MTNSSSSSPTLDHTEVPVALFIVSPSTDSDQNVVLKTFILGYTQLLLSLTDGVSRWPEFRSAVSYRVIDLAVELIQVLLQLPRVEGPNSIKGTHDDYALRLRDMVDLLYTELASLARHFSHHRDLEIAASTYTSTARLMGHSFWLS